MFGLNSPNIKKLLTNKKIFDIIIIENERGGCKMNVTIIFMLTITALALTGIPAALFDKIDRVKHQRWEKKRKFVREHKGYGLDAKGNIVKL